MAGPNGSALTIPEIRKLDLEAEFVFLSSCEGARLNSRRASGLGSFVRAFLEAGAGSVLASAEPVDDHAASIFAHQFYEHWIAGKSKAAALRAAQLDLLGGQSDYGHPFYWGHYQLHRDGM